MRLLLSALAAACLLSACAPSTPSAVKVTLPELPEQLATCPALQSVSGRIGNVDEVGTDRIVTIWAQDRTVAVQCRRRLESLATFYETLRADLGDHPDE